MIPGLVNKIYHILRKLAKTNKYQTLYHNSKEGCINLFYNQADYTELQIIFLQYLSFYASLNLDIYTEEVSDIVLEDELYEDAYQAYKNKIKKNNRPRRMETPQQKQQRKAILKKKSEVSNTHVVFRKPRIKR